MRSRQPRRPRPPLDETGLNELALTYVGRFATTRSKLASYLARKLRERGWGGTGEPPVERIVERCAANGFVDNSAFALAKARSLSGRGYGAGRLRQSLHAAGVEEADSEAARAHADAEKVTAALHFARKRRLGPFAHGACDPSARQRSLAAMIRAGHSFDLANAILRLPPTDGDEPPDFDEIAGRMTG